MNLFPKAATVPAPCGTTPSAAPEPRRCLRMNLSLEHEKALLEKCDHSLPAAAKHHENPFAQLDAHDGTRTTLTATGHRNNPFAERGAQDRQGTKESPGNPSREKDDKTLSNGEHSGK